MPQALLKSILSIGFLALCLPATPGLSRPPNVVLILADDLGWTDLGSYGSDLHQTPHLDRLAREGMQFSQAYSACTVCSPTRASLLTGQYPARLRVTDWIEGHKMPHRRLNVPDWTMRLEPSLYTLAEALRDSGYVTGHFGKWHLGKTEADWPEHHGFSVNRGGWGMGQPTRTQSGGGYFSPYANPRLTDGPPGEHLDQRLAQEAAAFMEANRERPFFINFWLYTVHTPLEAEAAKVARYRTRIREGGHHQNATYAAMVEHMDDAVGTVLQALDRLGLANNTMVIFTSDNGGLLGGSGGKAGKAQPVTSNLPLRLGKGERYEGGVRVPLLVRYPPLVAAGSKTARPAISPDLYPTVVDLVGASRLPSLPTFDGISLVPVLRDGSAVLARDAVFWHYPHYHTEGAAPYSAIRQDNWKLVHSLETDTVELFNLETDIGETNDLSKERPDLTVALRSRLAVWLNSVQAQYPSPNPRYKPAP